MILALSISIHSSNFVGIEKVNKTWELIDLQWETINNTWEEEI
jgi:hypothetical protein